MILNKVFEHYSRNIKAALAFALLLVFVPAFSFFENVFASTGTMLVDYNANAVSEAVFLAPIMLVFLVFYSFLISVIIFSVRKSLSKLKLQFYLHEMIQKFTLKIFIFYVLFSTFSFAAVIAMVWLGFGAIPVSLALLVISVATMFAPQSIVVDEEGVDHSIMNSAEFIVKHPKRTIQILVMGSVLLAVVSVVGHLLDGFYFVGSYISLLLTLVFVLPFVEIMKTYIFMLKFDLIKSPQLVGDNKRKEQVESKDLSEASKRIQ